MRINIQNLGDLNQDVALSFPFASYALHRITDPMLAALLYLTLVFFAHDIVTQQDKALALIAALIFFPSTKMTGSVRRYIIGVLANWSKVLVLLWLFNLIGNFSYAFDMNLVYLWAALTPLVVIGTRISMVLLRTRFDHLADNSTAIVIGASEVGQHLAGLIGAKNIPNQRFIGYFDDRPASRSGAPADQVLGVLEQAPEYVKRERIDMVYVALPMASQPRIIKLLDGLRDTTATVKFVPDMFIADLIQAKVESAAGLPVIAICDTPFTPERALQKRGFDLLVCLLALPVILPVMLAIGLLIRLTSAGPALFKQRRYGLNGEEIVVWKFRTMKVMEDGATTYTQTTRDDDRITTFGKFLRKSSLDELPQLINVLTGSMSLVGPRPHAVAVNETYRSQISGYMVRHKVKPGITGLAQVSGFRGGDDLYSMGKRIEYDLIYLRSWSLELDIGIAFRTALMLLKGDPKAY